MKSNSKQKFSWKWISRKISSSWQFSDIRTSGIKLVTDRVPKIGILGWFGSGIEKLVDEGKLNKTITMYLVLQSNLFIFQNIEKMGGWRKALLNLHSTHFSGCFRIMSKFGFWVPDPLPSSMTFHHSFVQVAWSTT